MLNKAVLITGGLGFIGRHTAQALAALGQKLVLTQHSIKDQPEFITTGLNKIFFIEDVDLREVDSLLSLGKKYEITGIIHLAGSLKGGAEGTFQTMQESTIILSNIFQVSYFWKCRRVIIASAIGVYNGVGELPWREDQALSFSAAYPVEVYKKSAELFSSFVASSLGIECITVRIAGVYGPLFNPVKGRSLAGKLIHAALNETPPDLSNVFGSVSASDGFDWCYVKDCARALALLQLSKHLRHRIYNIGSGRPVKNGEFVTAIKKLIPGFTFLLPESPAVDSSVALPYLDISRLKTDTGFEPGYSIESGVADYINWLRAGNLE